MSTVSSRRTEIVVDANDGTFQVHVIGQNVGAGQSFVSDVRVRMADPNGGGMTLPHANTLGTLEQLRDLIGEVLALAKQEGL